jgi:hypothetical protein
MKNKFLGYLYLGCTGTSEKEECLNGIKKHHAKRSER